MECGDESAIGQAHALGLAMEEARKGRPMDARCVRLCREVGEGISNDPRLWAHFEGDIFKIQRQMAKVRGRKRKITYDYSLDCRGNCCTGMSSILIKLPRV